MRRMVKFRIEKCGYMCACVTISVHTRNKLNVFENLKKNENIS